MKNQENLWIEFGDSMAPRRLLGQGRRAAAAISGQREALHSDESQAEGPSVHVLAEHDIRSLLEFFTILDGWDREAHEV